MNNREEVNDEPTKEVVSSIAESIDQAKPSKYYTYVNSWNIYKHQYFNTV